MEKRLTRKDFLQASGLVTAGVAALGVGHLVLPGEARAVEGYQGLRAAWRDLLTGGKAYDPSDPDIANRIKQMDAQARGFWDSMEKAPGRAYLWKDRASATVSSHITGSYDRLKEMARVYVTRGSSLEGDVALRDDILGALDWMYENRYNEDKAEYDNWWDWEIGTPLSLNNTVVLLHGELAPDRIADYMNAVDKFCPDPTRYSRYDLLATGANRVWKAEVVAVRGAIVEDGAKLAAARDALSVVFPYVTSGDGFYEDGSFIQHAKFPYTGGYGTSLLAGLANVLYLLSGSSWEVTDPNKRNVYRWVYDSFEPVIYKGAIMDMVRGREMSRSYSDRSSGHQVIQAIIRLSRSAPEANRTAFERMAKYWIQADTYRNFFGYAPVPMIVLGKEISSDPNVVPRGELIAHKQFPAMDRVVHLRPGFGFALSMSSSRIANYESGNNENLKGWYTADGMTYLYDDDLAQYSDGFWPTVNPYRLPGTTVDTQTRTPVAIHFGREYLSSKNWVGGAELGGTWGVSGMELDASGDLNAGGAVETPSSLTARKSWFMFDEEIVALGAGITSTDGRVIETVVENRKLNGAGDNTLTVNGAEKPGASGWSETMDGVEWAHLDGTGGYYFPGAATVKGLREARTGSWNEINKSQSATPLMRNYLTLWFDHGSDPTDETYAYVLLPNKSPSEVSSYAEAPDVEVVENSAGAQAVRERRLNILAANFWNDAAKKVDFLTCDKKASVMVRQTGGGLELAISDPTQANDGNIDIEIRRSASRVVSADPAITVRQLSPSIRLTVDVNGARGRTLKAGFDLTGRRSRGQTRSNRML